MRRSSSKLALALLLVLAPVAVRAADEAAPNRRPVRAVADARIEVAPGAVLPLYLSADWSVPQPDVTRAVLVLHGRLRNADVYDAIAHRARAAAGEAGRTSLLVVPQFLAGIDAEAHHLPPDTLRWTLGGWEGGEAALGPRKLSSFAALDAILTRLADRRLFPHLAQVVVAGHSGGAQVVQRYAIAGRGETALAAAGIAVRYVVANPSSYAWFSPERPEPAIAAACPGVDRWKYGMQDRPPAVSGDVAGLEARYVARQVVYLLGARDTNPAHSSLDRTCMAEAQGPTRFARGHAFVAAMQARDAGTPNHVAWDVPGVGHDADRMFGSAAGLAALFDAPGTLNVAARVESPTAPRDEAGEPRPRP